MQEEGNPSEVFKKCIRAPHSITASDRRTLRAICPVCILGALFLAVIWRGIEPWPQFCDTRFHLQIANLACFDIWFDGLVFLVAGSLAFSLALFIWQANHYYADITPFGWSLAWMIPMLWTTYIPLAVSAVLLRFARRRFNQRDQATTNRVYTELELDMKSGVLEQMLKSRLSLTNRLRQLCILHANASGQSLTDDEVEEQIQRIAGQTRVLNATAVDQYVWFDVKVVRECTTDSAPHITRYSIGTFQVRFSESGTVICRLGNDDARTNALAAKKSVAPLILDYFEAHVDRVLRPLFQGKLGNALVAAVNLLNDPSAYHLPEKEISSRYFMAH